MKIALTGGHGFLGWHFRAWCETHTDHVVTLADRATFDSPAALDEFVSGADAIVHLAGVNRAADDSTIRSGNVDLAQALADALQRTPGPKTVVFANSTHVDGDSTFGQAKKESADILAAACQDNGAAFVDVVFPHLFGEFGQPFYNSAVHTFAHQLVVGEQPTVLNDGELNLLHAQAACAVIGEAIGAADITTEQLRPDGERMLVSAVLARLEHLANPYLARGDVPHIDDLMDLRLFNLIRSNMYPDHYPLPMTVHSDPRGGFYEVLRAHGQGQTSISTTVPGITRGEHYHLDKVERFVVVAGEATISMRQLFTDQVTTYRVSGDTPVAIDMPPLTTHNIINVGSTELVTMFWSNDHFDPDNPDTFGAPVMIDNAQETVK